MIGFLKLGLDAFLVERKKRERKQGEREVLKLSRRGGALGSGLTVE